MCIAIPEISVPVGHTVWFRMRFRYLDFVEMCTVFWIKMEDGAMVGLDTPEVVADPCDTVWSVAWAGSVWMTLKPSATST